MSTSVETTNPTPASPPSPGLVSLSDSTRAQPLTPGPDLPNPSSPDSTNSSTLTSGTSGTTDTTDGHPKPLTRPWPEPTSSYNSQLFFTYLSPLFAASPLSRWSYTPNTSDCAASLTLPQTPPDPATTLPRNLSRLLLSLNKDAIVQSAFFQLIFVLTSCTQPLLLRLLINLVAYPSTDFTSLGVTYSLTLGCLTFIGAIANQRVIHLSQRVGHRVRTTLVNEIFAVAANAASTRTAASTAQTLVTIDADKIRETLYEMHLLWSCPLQFLIITVLLLWVIGPSSILGILLLLFLVPLVKVIIRKLHSIRKLRMPLIDSRVQQTETFFQSIKTFKLNNWELQHLTPLRASREGEEQRLILKELQVWGVTLVCMVMSPVIATYGVFVFYTTVFNGVLLPGDTFAVLCLIGALRFPVNNAGKLMGNLATSWQGLMRVANFIYTNPPSAAPSPPSTHLLSLAGSFSTAAAAAALAPPLDPPATPAAITPDPISSPCPSPFLSLPPTPHFTLSTPPLQFSRSTLTAIIGPVGSGKSTLLRTMLSLTAPLDDSAVEFSHPSAPIAYAPQTPFILNATIRDNITFYHPFDPTRYVEVIRVCCLQTDFDLAPDGDGTEIGERGVTLSGGQKARVSLARALYCPDSLLLLLDDPLSALDSETGKKVFSRLSSTPLLEGRATLMVTHAAYLLHHFDRILVLYEGDVISDTPHSGLDEIQAKSEGVKKFLNEINAVEQDTGRGSLLLPAPPDASNAVLAVVLPPAPKAPAKQLMQQEVHEEGVVSFQTFLFWFKQAGGFPFVSLQFLFLVGDRFSYAATEYWLSRWTEAAVNPIDVLGLRLPAQTADQSPFIVTYSVLLLASFFFCALRTEWAVTGGARAANQIWRAMLSSTGNAPMSFFESVPLGRLISRFTYDVEQLDIKLVQTVSVCMIATSWFVTSVVIMVTINPFMLAILIPVFTIYYRLQLYYRRTSVDLQRLDAKSRSPISSLVAELLDGLETISAFKQQRKFQSKFRDALDYNTSCMLAFTTSQRWVGLRIDCAGAVVTTVAALLIVTTRDLLPVSGGIAGLLINWTLNFSITLQFLVTAVVEAEAAITSVERCLQLTSVAPEAPQDLPSDADLPPSWPATGALSFSNVSARYRPGLPLAARSLTFDIPDRTRVGVCGRTGAGKSTLTSILFRLIEVEEGTVVLDGVDLAKLGLAQVRGRNQALCIISQDPVLFSGPVRQSIDVFSQHSDESVKEALAKVRLSHFFGRQVENGGENLSAGERQLLCLARALLAKPKLLVLDEATASVDGETDAFIQKQIREHFNDCSIICIAHRLNTIIDYDQILVIADGRVAEAGRPSVLLEKAEGHFSKLVDSTGKESARSLREMAG